MKHKSLWVLLCALALLLTACPDPPTAASDSQWDTAKWDSAVWK
jgi:starvation-inducible outer membrane lipoprotein